MFGKKKAAPAKAAPAAPKSAGDAKSSAKAPAKKGGLKLPFGKKKAEAPAPAKPAAPAPKPAGDAKPATKAPAKAKAKGGGPLKLILPLLVVVALGVGIFFVYTRFLAPGSKPEAATQAIANVPDAEVDNADSLAAASKANARKTRQAEAANAGDANAENSGDATITGVGANCVTAPAFLGKLGLGSNALFEVSDTHRLVLLVPAPDSDAVSKYQNQSWSQAGLVGAFALDREGNVYVAPSPRLGPGVKAAKPQNVIYKVDTNTGNLAPYVTLPDANAPSPENPYGIVGLAYDCDTNSLYVSTLAGSTADKEAGHIYRVDLNLGVVAGRMDNVDALGLAVGNGANGKVLYFGAARAPQLRAVNLEASGDFQGKARDVGTLTEPQRALRLRLLAPTEMVVQAVEFQLANADTPQGSEIRFQYDPASDTWNAAE
jgi:hypothetical protein